MESGAQAIYFGPAERQLFGWLHAARADNALGVGLVICNPLGYEAICCHRTIRHAAELASAAGIAALRFDYDGTGDSIGDDLDASRGAAWIGSIQVAVAELRRLAGVSCIYLMGIRLGGLLALRSDTTAEIDGLVLIQPIVSGRRYLRELRALAGTSVAGPADLLPGDLQQAAGFVTTAETRAWLSGIDVKPGSLSNAPPRALLVERSDLPADADLAATLADLGTKVSHLPFAGYADMMADAHETVVPADLLRRLVSWIVDSVDLVDSRTRPVPTAPDPTDTRFSYRLSGAGEATPLVESAVWLDPQRTLFGIVTQPDRRTEASISRRILMLLNAGAVHHVGPNRLYVELARSCAAMGLTVVRLDISGLGDSPTRVGEIENTVYSPVALPDVALATAYLHDRFPSSELHCAGICSGAYYSLKAAASGIDLRSVCIINPLTYFWNPSLSLAVPAHQDASEMQRYRRSGRQLRSWIRLLSGKVDLRNIAATVLRRATKRLTYVSRECSRMLGLPVKEDLATEIRALAERGVLMHFVFSDSDPGLRMLREQAGGALRSLAASGSVQLATIADSDHTFTPYRAQRELLSLLRRHFDPTQNGGSS